MACIATYPRSPGAVADFACRCLRRDVDRSVLHVAAAGAWKESLTEGLRSRRPGPTASGEAPAMAWSPLAARMAQGLTRSTPARGGAHKPKSGPGQKSPTRGRRTATRGPPRSRGAPSQRGLSRRPGRVSWGRRTTGPRVADAAPAYPSHSRDPFARNGRRVRQHQPVKHQSSETPVT